MLTRPLAGRSISGAHRCGGQGGWGTCGMCRGGIAGQNELFQCRPLQTPPPLLCPGCIPGDDGLAQLGEVFLQACRVDSTALLEVWLLASYHMEMTHTHTRIPLIEVYMYMHTHAQSIYWTHTYLQGDAGHLAGLEEEEEVEVSNVLQEVCAALIGQVGRESVEVLQTVVMRSCREH